jgi:hypothetical protein
MSMINLLTVGATFKDVKDRSGSYKLSSIASLPKFNAAKTGPSVPVTGNEPIAEAVRQSQGSLINPTTAAAPRQSKAVNPGKTQEVIGTQLQAGRSPNFQGVGSEGTTDLPANNPTPIISSTLPEAPMPEAPPRSAKPATISPAAAASAPLVGVRRLMHQFLFGNPARPVDVATVQTELVLDKVTVVRNDLSEESWPGDSRSQRDSATTRVDAPDTAGAWFDLTARFGKKTAPAGAMPAAKFTERPSRKGDFTTDSPDHTDENHAHPIDLPSVSSVAKSSQLAAPM